MSAVEISMDDVHATQITVDSEPAQDNVEATKEFSETVDEKLRENSPNDLLPGKEKESNDECFRQKMRKNRPLVLFAANLQSFVGEFIGTFILVTAICTTVTLAAVVGQLVGLWQVVVLIAIGLGLAIYISAHISDAHLNPAVTLAFAIVRYKVFSWKKIPVYVVAQMLGGFFAAAIMFGFYHNAIEAFEESTGIERGENGSERSAMIFGEYFPNPAVFGNDNGIVSMAQAFFIEAWGTAILVFVIFSLTDSRNTTVGSGNNKVVVPILIGLTLGFLIALYGSLTQAGYNPARDFGPRLFAAIAGWGKIAIPGPRNGFWLYIVAPLIGGPIGGALHDLGVANIMRLKRFLKPSQEN